MHNALEKDSPERVLHELGVTVESVFVPFSQSRSKDQETPNLNWRVTVKRNGKEVLTTDYSAGCGHAPGYKVKSVPVNFIPKRYTRLVDGVRHYRPAEKHEALAQYRDALTAAECESGYAMRLGKWGRNPSFETIGGRPGSSSPVRKIEPKETDVMYSLALDSDVLEYPTFEEWAGCLGWDTDSRKAESIYRACIETALKMRAGFGESGLAALHKAFEDY